MVPRAHAHARRVPPHLGHLLCRVRACQGDLPELAGYVRGLVRACKLTHDSVLYLAATPSALTVTSPATPPVTLLPTSQPHLRLGRDTGPGSSDMAVNMLGAVSAGAVSSTSTNPLWVIKTRMMVRRSRPTGRGTRIAGQCTCRQAHAGETGVAARFADTIGTDLVPIPRDVACARIHPGVRRVAWPVPRTGLLPARPLPRRCAVPALRAAQDAACALWCGSGPAHIATRLGRNASDLRRVCSVLFPALRAATERQERCAAELSGHPARVVLVQNMRQHLHVPTRGSLTRSSRSGKRAGENGGLGRGGGEGSLSKPPAERLNVPPT